MRSAPVRNATTGSLKVCRSRRSWIKRKQFPFAYAQLFENGG